MMDDDERSALTWVPVECLEADEIRNSHDVVVGAGRTDIDGEFGQPMIFSEWWERDTERPVLRDLLYDPHTSKATCRHYAPVEPGRLAP